jgi:endonuclease/exonuclease/phosphatase (EEP) superfamily protein YafD
MPSLQESADSPLVSSSPIALVQQSQLLTAALWMTTGGLLLLALSPAVSGLGVVFDLAANLSTFAAPPLVIIAVCGVMSRRRAVAGSATLGVVAAVGWFLARADWPATPGKQSVETSLLFCNIEGQPAAWPRLRALVEQRQPDLIAIVEAEPAILEAIAADSLITKSYPFRIMPQPGWNWAQVLLSRHPLTPLGLVSDDPRYKFLFSFHRASVVALPQGGLILTAEHPPSPRSPAAWRNGNEKVRLLCEVCRDYFAPHGLPLVVAGDFNTSPTGYRVRLLKELAGLHGDPCAGLNYGSWPSSLPAPLRITLDRVWANESVAFTSREVLPDIGSDHRPILVRFRLKSTGGDGDSRE